MMGGPRIKHVDDVMEQEVVRLEFDDGRSASVHERFMEQLPNFVSFYNRWDPGMMQRKHGHRGHHVVFIISGSMTVGGVECRAGSHIFLMDGDTFGPWIAGPEGAVTLGVVAGMGTSFAWPEDDVEFLEFIKTKGARRGAVPPAKGRPPWAAGGFPGEDKSLTPKPMVPPKL